MSTAAGAYSQTPPKPALREGCLKRHRAPPELATGPAGTFFLLLSYDRDGMITSVEAARGGPPLDPRTRAVFDLARTTFLEPKCSPVLLPPELAGKPGTILIRMRGSRGMFRLD
ncbi:hypothetical protein [Roseomonas elaeocarpi]|uniref:TonB C-terminal domain-containing protein n=1 Tax=Roseomonas elaeocarpi TaxID=907779 RepID=A0ABV6JXD3_9PROT